MEEFDRREIVEILLPNGFQPAGSAEFQPPQGVHELPVELIVGWEGAPAEPGTVSREARSQEPPPSQGAGIEGTLALGAEDSILVIAPDGTVTRSNNAALRRYGYSQEELIGKPVEQLLPVEQRAREERIRNKVLGGESVPAYDTARIAKDRETIPVSVAVSAIRDAAGSVVGTSEIARDISDRQKVEKELAAKIDTLSRSNQELQDYSMVVAHDLQAPLNLVTKYFSELSRRCGDLIDAETTELLTTAADAVPRMQRLIKELLELARVDGRGFNRVETDCSAVVTQALSNLEVPLKESNAKVTVGPMPRILADPTQLGQVFQNLVANAIKFRGDSTPVIHIGAELRAGEWRFSVSDNGIGIAPELIPRLFQPHQRLHAGGPYAGSGLGLAIARKIMTRHGGRIWVESRSGGGTVFHFTIPTTETRDSTDSP
jgi:PAS domain S-box-containing protein